MIDETRAIENEYQGSKKVTCREAAEMVRKDKVRMVLWRPGGKINYKDSDGDPALIWLKD